jgi:long-subunit acyl-CoA synthetase (AMP-forming)
MNYALKTRVRDAAVNVGEEGEVLIRSVCCTISYLNNPEATADSFTEDGWFCTGDIGKLDPEGNLYITDRLKELIKVKGCVAYPSSVALPFSR